jgi:hypothetical protein
MNRPWFDVESGHVLFDEYIASMPSFQAINQDNIVTEEELAQQAVRVIDLLRKLQSELPPEVRELAGNAFCELAVLHALHAKFQESAWRP